VKRRDVAGEAVVSESETVKVAVPLTQLTMNCLSTVDTGRRRHVSSSQPLHLHVLRSAYIPHHVVRPAGFDNDGHKP